MIIFIILYFKIFKIQLFRNEVHSKYQNNDGDDDTEKGGCEMEYLRNILYEYMMGKQPMVIEYIMILIQFINCINSKINFICS